MSQRASENQTQKGGEGDRRLLDGFFNGVVKTFLYELSFPIPPSHPPSFHATVLIYLFNKYITRQRISFLRRTKFLFAPMTKLMTSHIPSVKNL